MYLSRILISALSIVLLAYILKFVDATAVFSKIVVVGVTGVGTVFGVYMLVFVIDSITWHLAMTQLPFVMPLLYRSWKVRMVGEACNMVLPVCGMGGEPVKAVLMKNHGLDYRESIVSLILAKTINLIALVFFLGVGFWLILLQPALPMLLTALTGVGLTIFATAIFCFFIAQRWRIASRVGVWLSQTKVGCRIRTVLHHVEDMDDRMTAFYTLWRTRFVWAVILAICSWCLCAFETYCAARFLGIPISFTNAWVIETLVQMVRAVFFFVPASVGVQEGVFLVAFTAFSVLPAEAMSVALLKRGREIAWIALGGIFGISYLLSGKKLTTQVKAICF